VGNAVTAHSGGPSGSGVRLTLDEFEAQFGVVEAPDGEFYHAFPQPPEWVAQWAGTNRLWTAVDGDYGHYLLRGAHRVNAWGYVVTERPVPDFVHEVDL
jgi:hypothetical protein